VQSDHGTPDAPRPPRRRCVVSAPACSGDGACEGCADAAAEHAATGTVVICVCGTVHGPDDWRWPTANPRTDRAVVLPVTGQHAGDGMAARAAQVDGETERVTRLLAELRPTGAGPYGLPTALCVPSPVRVVVQGGSSPAGGVPGARLGLLAARAPRDLGAYVLDRLRELEVGAPAGAVGDRQRRAVGTLRWLRDNGTLARGLGELYRAVGAALGGVDGVHRAVATGHRLTDEAGEVWWT
jgi:hypothetical protein